MDHDLIVVGKNSYVGGYFAQSAAAGGARVAALGSRDCDFLSEQEVVRFFRGVGPRPATLLFFAVVNKSAANTQEAFAQNLTMVRNLIKATQIAPIRSLIHFSSVDVFGRNPVSPLTEASPLEPDSWYGRAKADAERLLLDAPAPECPVTVLRLPGVYGHGANDRSVIGKMVTRVQQRLPVEIHGSGRVLRDFVYVEDVCRLVMRLLPLRYRGVLNVATGRSLPVVEVAERVHRALGREPNLVHVGGDAAREFDLVFDISRLRADVPGFAFQDLDVGLRSYAGRTAAAA
jgi:UDP-glucose 4-epimerase